MKHYYKAKEFVLEQTKTKDESYQLNNHVIFTAYYAIKHNISNEELYSYIDKVTKRTYKKLWACGCKVDLVSPLGNRITHYESGGYWKPHAYSEFRLAVHEYYYELKKYNEDEDAERE